mmetsp:Transcript_2379/g.9293  ORF Transcript_2379/g.9293 Transcript_2379/m.9293 type:complete len:232 (-) Transcript_2379:693-1388(-)
MRIIMSRKSLAVMIDSSSTYRNMRSTPFARIFLRVLYRPARISRFFRFFFNRDPLIRPFASGFNPSKDACNEISLERTNAANSSNDIFPVPLWSPSSTKSCTNARGMRRLCANMSRSSWPMYPVPIWSMRENSSRSLDSRSCHGFERPRFWQDAFNRDLRSSQLSHLMGPRSGPATTNVFSTNPSAPQRISAYCTLIPIEPNALPMSAIRFTRSLVMTVILVNPLSESSST